MTSEREIFCPRNTGTSILYHNIITFCQFCSSLYEEKEGFKPEVIFYEWSCWLAIDLFDLYESTFWIAINFFVLYAY